MGKIFKHENNERDCKGKTNLHQLNSETLGQYKKYSSNSYSCNRYLLSIYYVPDIILGV